MVGSFESGDLSNWQVLSGNPTVVEDSTFAYDGSFYCESPTDNIFEIIGTASSLDVEEGVTSTVYSYIESGSDPLSMLYSPFYNNGNNYYVGLRTFSGSLNIIQNDSNGFNSLASTSVTVPRDEWLQYSLEWGSGGSFTGELSDSSGTIGTVTTTTSVPVTTGKVGFIYNFTSAGKEYLDNFAISGGVSPPSAPTNLSLNVQ